MCFSTSVDLDELLRKSILSGFYLVCPFSCPILSSNSWKAHSAGARPLLFGNKSGSREVEGRRGVNMDLKAQTRRSPEFVSTFMQGGILECVWCIWCAVWITISCQSQSNPKNAGMQPSRLNVRFAPNTSVSPLYLVCFPPVSCPISCFVPCSHFSHLLTFALTLQTSHPCSEGTMWIEGVRSRQTDVISCQGQKSQKIKPFFQWQNIPVSHVSHVSPLSVCKVPLFSSTDSWRHSVQYLGMFKSMLAVARPTSHEES